MNIFAACIIGFLSSGIFTGQAQEIRVMLEHLDSNDIAIEVPEGGFVVERADGSVPVSSASTVELEEGLIVASKESRQLYWRGKPYRGRLEIRRSKEGKLALVNVLDVEEYLYGVLPSEVDAHGWPMEALKAQAVASRSYALFMIGQDPEASINVGAAAKHQVYFGAGVEAGPAKDAVDSTKGEVLQDALGSVVPGYFHSTCGGHTESARYVWPGATAEALVGVSDFGACRDSPHYSWVTSIPAEELASNLRRAGYDFEGPLRAVNLGELSKSHRIINLRIIAADQRMTISTEKLRQAMGPNWLKSTMITRVQRKNDRFLFYGRGWGHGVGLCQWGSKERAGQKAWDYARILKLYFPKAKLGKIEHH